MPPTTYGRRALVALAASAVLLGGAAVPAVAAPPAATAQAGFGYGVHGDSARLAYQKEAVTRVLKGVFEDGDTEVVDRYVRPDYIQHNPVAPDGAETLKNLGTQLARQFPDARYDIKRIISEGDMVLVHANVVVTPGAPGMAVFDIFRFRGRMIAEHWDLGQNVPEGTAGGNDMFSTESWPRTEEPGPRWQNEYNKRLVEAYVDRLLVKKDLTAVDKFVGRQYHEHNPDMADGVKGLKAGMGAYFKKFPHLKVMPKRMIVEGDLVAVHSHYVETPGSRGKAVLDLFRVQGGKVKEHWVSFQDVPATAANDNTMF